MHQKTTNPSTNLPKSRKNYAPLCIFLHETAAPFFHKSLFSIRGVSSWRMPQIFFEIILYADLTTDRSKGHVN